MKDQQNIKKSKLGMKDQQEMKEKKGNKSSARNEEE
jgi:hypothetical protein